MSWYGTKLARDLRKRQTPEEKLLWKRLRNRKFMNLKFYRQYAIPYGNNQVFVVDFYCHEKKLVIELDGKIHLKRKEEDQERDEVLNELGYKVFRIKNEELSMLPDVLRKIETLCRT